MVQATVATAVRGAGEPCDLDLSQDEEGESGQLFAARLAWFLLHLALIYKKNANDNASSHTVRTRVCHKSVSQQGPLVWLAESHHMCVACVATGAHIFVVVILATRGSTES